MPQSLGYPGAPGNLYRARGDEVQAHRSIFTGDIFTGVEVQSIGETKLLSVMVLQHPCALRIRGERLHPRLLVAEVRGHQLFKGKQWTGSYRVMPLPDLMPDAEGAGRHQAALLDEIYLASPGALQDGIRVACLSQLGVDLLMQRWVNHNSRVIVPTWQYLEVTGGPYEEADLVEEWCEDQMAAGLTTEEAEAEALKWIREENSSGVMRQKLLSDPQQRSTVRKEMRAHLRYLRGA